MLSSYSNTTLVKVKLTNQRDTIIGNSIQIQLLLKLNCNVQGVHHRCSSIQIQLLLKLNYICKTYKSDDKKIQIQLLLKLNLSVNPGIIFIDFHSNTTLVKVKF